MAAGRHSGWTEPPIWRVAGLLAELEKVDPKAVLINTGHKRNRKNRVVAEDHRGTEFIGVTKNSNRYQAMIMRDKRKRYIGTYLSAEQAARAFDRAAIFDKGLAVSP